MANVGMSLPQLRELLQGAPFHRLFSMDLVAVDAADELHLRIEYTSAVERIAGGGQYHGGVLASLGDIAGSLLVAQMTGTGGATIHFSIDYLRPAVSTDVSALARMRRLGKTVSFVDIDLQAGSGQLVAVCRGVYAVSR